MTCIVGIDPGKSGFACMIEKEAAHMDGRPSFWATPVAEDDDGPVSYDVDVMAAFAKTWYGDAIFVVIEQQAPRRHSGKIAAKFGMGSEGMQNSWTNGYGFGLWRGVLAGVGFSSVRVHVVEPQVWKRRMGCLASHSGVDSQHARRKAADARSIEVAQVVAPGIDFRPLERTPNARVPSPDKACALLLAIYGARYVLGQTAEAGK